MNQQNTTTQHGRFIRFRRKYFPLLWFIAAADEDLLIHCPAADQDKQAGIGMAILCTSIAACISSYYAIQSLFGYWYTALPLAFFWGMIIFNLDRFMVVSIRKTKQLNLLKDALVIFPRIALALFIALLISKPLEVRIFLHQIESGEIGFKETQENKALQTRFNRVNDTKQELLSSDTALRNARAVSKNPDLDPVYHQTKLLYQSSLAAAERLDGRLVQLRARLAELPQDDDRRNALKGAVNNLSTRAREARQACHEREAQLQQRGLAYSREQALIVGQLQKRDSVTSQNLQDKEDILKRKADSLSQRVSMATQDILGQLRVLDSVKKEDSSIAAADLLITSLFFLLELAPLLIKMGSSRGRYDIMICIAEQQAQDEEGAAIEESRQARIIREEVAAMTNSHAVELDIELKEQVKMEILGAQADIAKDIVEAWKKQEKAQLNGDPAGYLKGKISTSNHTTDNGAGTGQ